MRPNVVRRFLLLAFFGAVAAGWFLGWFLGVGIGAAFPAVNG